VEAAGRLWSGRNRPGVANIPKFAAKIPWRESRKDRMSARGKAWEAVRQNEMVRGAGESQRKHNLTQADERSPSVTNGERRASGSPECSDALQGHWYA